MNTGSQKYIEGDKRVQWAFVALLVLSALLFLYIQSIIGEAISTIQVLMTENPMLAVKMAGRLLLWLVFSSGSIAIAIALYLVHLIGRIKQEHRYPPQGFPVAVRTEVREGAAARKVVNLCWFLVALLFLQPLCGLTIWFWITGAAW